MDQLESETSKFLGILRGFITKKRYRCATIFLDHYSGFTYIYPQNSTNTEEILRAKTAFEPIHDHWALRYTTITPTRN